MTESVQTTFGFGDRLQRCLIEIDRGDGKVLPLAQAKAIAEEMSKLPFVLASWIAYERSSSPKWETNRVQLATHEIYFNRVSPAFWEAFARAVKDVRGVDGCVVYGEIHTARVKPYGPGIVPLEISRPLKFFEEAHSEGRLRQLVKPSSFGGLRRLGRAWAG